MLAIYAIHWSRGSWGATKSFPTTCLLGVVARNAGICWNRMTLFISLFTIKTANLKTSGFVEKHRVFLISHVFVGFWVSRYIYILSYIYISYIYITLYNWGYSMSISGVFSMVLKSSPTYCNLLPPLQWCYHRASGCFGQNESARRRSRHSTVLCDAPENPHGTWSKWGYTANYNWR